jgi:hypothetical protein
MELSMRRKAKLSAPQPLDNQERPLDVTFTEAIPGCPEKIEFMKMRLERGVSLFHHLDRGIGENFRQLEDYDWNKVNVS